MKPEEIKLSDWGRILFGEVPPAFFLEVVIRTVIIFLLLIISMRLFGRRMAAQINRVEMVALFSLAAAIGVPLQTPDKGILPAIVIAIVVILIGRLIAVLAFGNERLEARIEDRLTILANDGVIDLKKMHGTKLTIERLYAQLRTNGIRHMGEVKRLYLEANGSFSVVKEQNPGCGLCILPVSDREFIQEQSRCEEQVCSTCGKKKVDNRMADVCTNCTDSHWEKAIV
ncbi:MAG TPA: YetF domain-containing protein [Flavisolibacter sp.]|jgi:uncharacterized membrane protein YcaP (DUF421 family)